MPEVRSRGQDRLDTRSRARTRKRAFVPRALLTSTALLSSAILWSPTALAVEQRDVSGELYWTSAALQGAAGQGALSESWVDQAHTDISLLARRKASFEMELFAASLVVSRDATNTMADAIRKFSDSNKTSGSTSSAQATATALDSVRSLFGKSMTAQSHASLLASRISRVGVAPYVTAALDATVDNSAWPKLDAYAGGYAGTLISYAQIIRKDFDLGVAIRPGVGGYRPYSLDLSLLGDFLSTTTQSSQQTNSFDFPTAVYCPLDLAFAWWAGPSTRFHVISKDTFDSAPLSVMSGSPGRFQSRIHLGMSQDVSLSGSKNQTLRIAAELQDVAGLKGGWNELLLRTQWAGRYAVKLPFRDQTTFAMNVGLHSGYPVVSLFFDMFLAKFEVALSAREKGGYAGQRPNRLQTVQFRTQMQF